MTNLLPLLTALLAASTAVASPGAGYRAHGKRRCAAGSAATRAAAASASASAPAAPGNNNVYVVSGDPLSVSGPRVAASNSTDNATANGTAEAAAAADATPNGMAATVPVPSGDATAAGDNTTAAAAASAGRPVFAHYMVGLTSKFDQAAWEQEIKAAQAKGIDGFALNIGKDDYNDPQLTNAYTAAAALGFKVFISVDFNWYNAQETNEVAAQLKKYIALPAQYMVGSQPLVSSFAGHDFDWKACSAVLGTELHAVPNWLQDGGDNIQGAPGLGSGSPPHEVTRQGTEEMAKRGAKGLFSWHVWPGQPTNTPVDQKLGTAADEKYRTFMGNNATYMAGVSPWCEARVRTG